MGLLWGFVVLLFSELFVSLGLGLYCCCCFAVVSLLCCWVYGVGLRYGGFVVLVFGVLIVWRRCGFGVLVAWYL